MLPLLLLFTVVACASTERLPGRYAVVFEPELTRAAPGGAFSEHVTAALRDRLGSVERVDAPTASGYDAVIIVRRAGTTAEHRGRPTLNPRPIASTTRTEPSTESDPAKINSTSSGDRQGRPVASSLRSPYHPVTLLEFDIVRNGQTVERGVARIEPNSDVSAIERNGRIEQLPVNHSNVYAASRSVATAVVETLKKSAS